ncbi:hypothetical protein [Spiroplasma sp. SV19]|uniref:hypothetical protein n=1 Tax=Spiroplasma sp. SV19 TaxID=2570468 RepID=UPI0024B7A894|nr:hypothetical protein [Spiroplasma sp. SV19]
MASWLIITLVIIIVLFIILFGGFIFFMYKDWNNNVKITEEKETEYDKNKS